MLSVKSIIGVGTLLSQFVIITLLYKQNKKPENKRDLFIISLYNDNTNSLADDKKNYYELAKRKQIVAEYFQNTAENDFQKKMAAILMEEAGDYMTKLAEVQSNDKDKALAIKSMDKAIEIMEKTKSIFCDLGNTVDTERIELLLKNMNENRKSLKEEQFGY